VVLAGNFDDALNEAGQQAEVQHLLQCYALESDLLDVAARGETVTDSHLARYGSSLEDYVGGKLVALYRGDAAAQGGTSSAAAETETEAEAQAASNAERQPAALRTVYTSFPWDEGPTGQTDTYRMHRDGGRTYMLFEAEMETVGNPPVTLLTGHDVTSVFAARDRALLRFWEMELVVLVCAGAMIALLSRWLTKPLARLTQASESIAGGAYGERTGLSGGDEIGVLSRSFDAMAAAVQEKVDALELSVRQREDFMSAFTHELKTPLTSIRGYVELLQDEKRDAQTRAKFYEIIGIEADRLQRLIDDLLELSRIENSLQKAPETKRTDVSKIALETLEHLSPMARERQVTFSSELTPELTIRADPDRMVQLFTNLIQNAVKYNRPGGSVLVATQAVRGMAVIRVEDTGLGIPQESLPRIFERFYRVDKGRSRELGGTGLGLSIVKHIVQLYGGDISVDSVVEKGTVFQVRFPLAH